MADDKPAKPLGIVPLLAWKPPAGTTVDDLMPSTEPSPSLTVFHRSMLALLAIAVVVAYANTLHVPFVYDDTLAIPENPTLRKLWPISDVLFAPQPGGVTTSGRPILNFSFALNHAVSGTHVWSYHAFNLLIHIGSALLLFGIVRRTLARPRTFRVGGNELAPPRSAAPELALASAALWALHPLATQAVTYTVQRAESLMGFFYLLTLYTFIRGAAGSSDSGQVRRHRGGWLALSVISCALGMGTKEVMATGPLLVLLYDRTFVSGTFTAAGRQRWLYYLGLGGTWLVLGWLLISTGGNRGGTVGLGVGLPLWAYPLTQFKALAYYLRLAIWPHPLVFEYGTFWVQRAADILPYLLVVLPLLLATIIAVLRRSALGFCGAAFFLILAPTSLAPGTIQMIVEHRMYLPLAAVVVVGVVVFHAWLGRRAWPGFALLALALGGLTYQRNHDYRSPLTLWHDTVTKRPDNPRAHDGLAEALEAAGQFDDALRHRQEALRLLPNESTYHYNTALTLTRAGRTADAIRHYQLSLRLFPNEARTHNNLAILLGETDAHEAALAHYAEAVRLRPEEPLYHYNRGIAQLRAGQLAEAVASYRETLRLQPSHADAQFNLGTALVRLNQLDEALSHYAHAVRARPADVGYRTTYGGALLLAQQPAAALTEFRAALALQTDATEARFGEANALTALGRMDEAISRYQALLAAEPNHAHAHYKLGNALLDTDRVVEALSHFQTAIRLSPNDAEAHHNLGVAYARMEQWPEAERAFQTALRLKPDYPAAQRNLEQLRRLLER